MGNKNITPATQVSLSEDKGSYITAVFGGEVLDIRSENPKFETALTAYRNQEWEKLYDIMKPAAAIKKAFFKHGSVVCEHGVVTFEGNEINNVVVDRILQWLEDDLDVKPLVKFLGRLLANPSQRAIDELYKFLDHEHLPINAEGFFVAYKGVDNDYKDIWTHKIDNSIGKTVRITREEVDHDKDKTCSYGLHAGCLDYAITYAGSRGKVVLVEIDPADVVSIPSDANGQKLRTCAYKVIADYVGPLRSTLYTTPDNADIDKGDYEGDDEGDDEIGTEKLDVTVDNCEKEDLTVFFGFAVGRALKRISDDAVRAATKAKLRWLRSAIFEYCEGDEEVAKEFVVDNSYDLGIDDLDSLVETLEDCFAEEDITLVVPDFGA